MTTNEYEPTSTACTSAEQAAHAPLVLQAIDRRLRLQGRLTFAEFMDIALYHPHDGYYAAYDARPRRDYRTSAAVHPLFGALVARQLEQMWHVLGAPTRFVTLESGAGDGALCRDILDHLGLLSPAFAKALRYVIVEPFPSAVCRQRSTIGGNLIGNVRWVSGSAFALPISGVVGCVLSNELIDSFPVHRVAVQDGVLFESYVVLRDGVLAETLGEPSTPALSQYFDRLSIKPPEGSLVEVNLCAQRYVREAAGALARGFVLTIDYGAAAEELYVARRPAGTLRCYRRHQLCDNPFQSLGEQDITSDVDFSSLVIAGRDAGLRFSGLTTQRDFLINLGFEAFVGRLEQAPLPAGKRYDNAFAAKELISRAGLGAFHVLVQHKGLADPALDAFNPANDRKRILVTADLSSSLPVVVKQHSGGRQ